MAGKPRAAQPFEPVEYAREGSPVADRADDGIGKLLQRSGYLPCNPPVGGSVQCGQVVPGRGVQPITPASPLRARGDCSLIRGVAGVHRRAVSGHIQRTTVHQKHTAGNSQCRAHRGHGNAQMTAARDRYSGRPAFRAHRARNCGKVVLVVSRGRRALELQVQPPDPKPLCKRRRFYQRCRAAADTCRYDGT